MKKTSNRHIGVAALLLLAGACSTDNNAPASADEGPPTTPDVLEPTDDAPAGDAPVEADAAGAACDQPLQPEGDPVAFTKLPYLMMPATDSITVAFETETGVPGRAVLYDSDDSCLAVVETTPVRMDTTIIVDEQPYVMDEPVGHQQFARIEGLEAGTVYGYRVIVGGTDTELRRFRTAPTAEQAYTIGLIGDTRTYDVDHQAVVDALALLDPQLIVHTGDLMSTAGILDDWDAYFAIESEILAEAPLVPMFGNHEIILGHAYWRGYIDVPNPFNVDERDYSFAYGNAYWVVFDSNFLVEGERLEWLERELAKGADYDFLFVGFHHPFYTFSKHVPDTAERDKLHPLFVKYGVSAAWNGHNHCYERFVVDGIHYLVIGGGGSSLYSVDSSIVPDEEPLRVAARSTHQYATLDVEGRQAIVTVWDVDNDELLESFEIAPRPR